jgi:hypothetical protein
VVALSSANVEVEQNKARTDRENGSDGRTASAAEEEANDITQTLQIKVQEFYILSD